ncbi:MAG: hypothetical protein FRX48_00634 [Lasallia pustulata]|uniref:Uncharacterized protein n=1 Tax=Lasallia pustulata TaxID=136370 RepID=A0A5M8Q3Y2_9LECA|nr:MAG: hypothetical protein FRX48_00634 [Lasallia pustulata]
MPEISEPAPTEHIAPVSLPRIAINFCTQCKWMLRAAYFAQELLSTFSTSLGEVSLIPSTGGVFTVDIIYAPSRPADETTDTGAAEVKTQTRRLWDRKSEGGFPETKVLKKLVRDIIDPTRDLGHVDGKKISVPPRTTADEVIDSHTPYPGAKDIAIITLTYSTSTRPTAFVEVSPSVRKQSSVQPQQFSIPKLPSQASQPDRQAATPPADQTNRQPARQPEPTESQEAKPHTQPRPREGFIHNRPTLQPPQPAASAANLDDNDVNKIPVVSSTTAKPDHRAFSALTHVQVKIREYD